ncbi:hypothetical protein [Neisseria dentiae]|uniref:hypothetical protein n=1 Tax=Neisseria dentiae TaxID=194197 RepID=UPI0035A01AC0
MAKILLAGCILLAGACFHKAQADAEQMKGSVHFSFERAEFVYQNQAYYLAGNSRLLADEAARIRAGQNAYNVTLNDVCINGRILTKAQNNGNGFGPLGRYNQAVAVESLC